MLKREELRLADGSRWLDKTSFSVIDNQGAIVEVSSSRDNELVLFADDGAYIADALAVIRVAGLDQDLNEALTENERLKSEVHYAKQIVKAVREGSRELEDRLEAANKRIAELESANAALRARDDYVESCLL